MLRYGNDRLDRWAGVPGLARPAWIAKAVSSIAAAARLTPDPTPSLPDNDHDDRARPPRRRGAEALRDELNATRFTRRELNRMGLLAGGAYFGVRGLALRQALAQTVTSPKLTPWKDEMPVPRAMGDSGHQDGYDVTKHQWCAG